MPLTSQVYKLGNDGLLMELSGGLQLARRASLFTLEDVSEEEEEEGGGERRREEEEERGGGRKGRRRRREEEEEEGGREEERGGRKKVWLFVAPGYLITCAK